MLDRRHLPRHLQSATVALPQPPQDPIPSLTGHGYDDVTQRRGLGASKSGVRRDIHPQRRLESGAMGLHRNSVPPYVHDLPDDAVTDVGHTGGLQHPDEFHLGDTGPKPSNNRSPEPRITDDTCRSISSTRPPGLLAGHTRRHPRSRCPFPGSGFGLCVGGFDPVGDEMEGRPAGHLNRVVLKMREDEDGAVVWRVSPHQPLQSESPHSPRTGPNMLRPMMVAPMPSSMSDITCRLTGWSLADRCASREPQSPPTQGVLLALIGSGDIAVGGDRHRETGSGHRHADQGRP